MSTKNKSKHYLNASVLASSIGFHWSGAHRGRQRNGFFIFYFILEDKTKIKSFHFSNLRLELQ